MQISLAKNGQAAWPKSVMLYYVYVLDVYYKNTFVSDSML